MPFLRPAVQPEEQETLSIPRILSLIEWLSAGKWILSIFFPFFCKDSQFVSVTGRDAST